MYKLVLKKLYMNTDIQINFNRRENYIIGKNNTGKTTIFNLIQYVLGLKKTAIKSLTIFGEIIKPYIECEFDNRVCKISRKIDSNEITFEGFINKTVKVGSNELNDIYTELLNINFVRYNNYNDKSALDILKMSFLSEIELSKTYLNKGNDYYKIIGYNEEYLKLIKKDISRLIEELQIESKSLKMVEQYKESVENSLFSISSKVKRNYEEIINVLNDEYTSFRENFTRNNKLLHNAEEVYKNELENFNEWIYKETTELNPYFQNILKGIFPSNSQLTRLDLNELLEMKNMRTSSMMQRIILLFALHITLCRNEIKNGLGVLITDNIFLQVDGSTMRNIRKKLHEVTSDGEIQYIEFCSDTAYISKDLVVFEMPSMRGGGFFD